MPTEIYSLATEINDFSYDYDTYNYKDVFENQEEGFDYIFSLLANGNADIIINWFNEILEEDDNERIKELKTRLVSLF